MTDHLPQLTQAFVIGPIGDKDAEDGSLERKAYEEGVQVFEEVIEPACRAAGLDAIRADGIHVSGEIPEQIFRLLRDSQVVIADLTGANPNVMYELGLRHTTGKLTIQIGEKNRLPFDIAAIRTIMFKRSDAGLVQARKDLAKTLLINLEEGGTPVAATRIWFESTLIESSGSLEADDNAAEIPNGRDAEPGFLELQVDMELGMQSLSQSISVVTSIFQNIASVINEEAIATTEANARSEGAATKLAIADRIAKRLDEEATKLEVSSGEYAKTVDRIEPGLVYLANTLASNPEQLKEAPELPEQLKLLSAAATESIESTIGMRDSAAELGKASRSLAMVARRFAPSFDRLVSTSKRVGTWDRFAKQMEERSDN
jgi:hypothetical protein